MFASSRTLCAATARASCWFSKVRSRAFLLLRRLSLTHPPSGAIPLDGTALDDAISAQLPAECAATAVVLATACRPSLSHANLDCSSQAKMLSHALHTDAAASPLPNPPIEFTLNTSLRADVIEQVSSCPWPFNAASFTLAAAGRCSIVQHGIPAAAGGGVHARGAQRHGAGCQLPVVCQYLSLTIHMPKHRCPPQHRCPRAIGCSGCGRILYRIGENCGASRDLHRGTSCS